MNKPLMPKATAVWLIENTTLTFDQVADFCGLHPLEVKGIADGEVAAGIVGMDPIANGQLTRDDIERCQKDPQTRLKMAKTAIELPKRKGRGGRYTPVSKRQDKPDAIAWIVKFHPEVTDAAISKLLGTTKSTIQQIRDRSHWNYQNIRPRDPVGLGLCTQIDLDEAVRKAQGRRAAMKLPEDQEPPPPAPEPEAQAPEPDEEESDVPSVESVFGPRS
ncbi:DUF1013 domain-containing protein [Desertibaculum subflavum]|uniref:DUF1013 domain-containing protein n=1 Tax=Desertibaculum subflavum TaxID=2268458 RepID=UPI000E664F8F